MRMKFTFLFIDNLAAKHVQSTMQWSFSSVFFFFYFCFLFFFNILLWCYGYLKKKEKKKKLNSQRCLHSIIHRIVQISHDWWDSTGKDTIKYKSWISKIYKLLTLLFIIDDFHFILFYFFYFFLQMSRSL